MSMPEAAAAMNAEILSGRQLSFDGIAVDSRRLVGGELFFALPGTRADGHLYVGKARRAGARGAVISSREAARRSLEEAGLALRGDEDFALLEVADPFAALHDLTRASRRRAPQHLVGITGSAGKTTTKSLLAAMLQQRYRTAASPGNLNNLYGFPVSLLSIPEDTEWMVAEIGMSTPGELAGVSRLARPEVALFTNVRAAHLEAFDGPPDGEAAGLEHIAAAKAELLEGLEPGGLVVINSADPHVVSIGERHLAAGGRALAFALDEPAADPRFVRPLRVRHCTTAVPVGGALGSRFELLAVNTGRTSAEQGASETAHGVEVALPLHGLVNVENFLAAATCAYALGVDLAAIARSASTLRPEPGRGLVIDQGRAKIIDDTYNSNPSALHSALQAARVVDGQRHWAVLGEMRELGRSSQRLHSEAGRNAAACGMELVVGVGDEARPLVEAAGEAGVTTAWFANSEDAVEFVRSNLIPGDVLLVKGSRGVHLERLIAALTTAAETSG